MKKLLITILVLCMVLLLVACKPTSDDHTVHTDNNADGICDGCDSIFIDYEKPTVVGTILKESLEAQLSNARSVRVKLEANSEVDESTWHLVDGSDEYLNNITKRKELNVIDFLISIKENSIDARISSNRSYLYETEGDTDAVSYVDEEVIYIIDGCIYQEIIDGTYTKTAMIPDEDVKLLVEKVLYVELMSEGERDEKLKELGTELATVFSLKDYKGSVSFDAKAAVESFLAYARELDLEADTLGGVLDDALALVSEELTTEAIVAQISRVADLSVNEALAELDEWLTANYGTTVQGIIDKVTDNPDVIELVETIIVMKESLDPNAVETREMLDDIIAQVQAFNLSESITEMGVGDISVYDFVISMTGAPEDAEVYTKDEFIQMISSYLGLTLAQVEQNLPIPLFSILKQAGEELTVNKLYGRLDLNFEGLLALKTVEGEFEFDVVSTEDVADGMKNTTRTYLQVKLNVSDISSAVVTVALPDGSKILDEEYVSNEFYAEDGSTVYTDYEVVDGDIECFIYVTLYNDRIGDYVELVSLDRYTEAEIKGEQIIISDFYISYGGENHYDIEEGTRFVFSLDPATERLTIYEMPVYKLNNEDADNSVLVEVFNGIASSGESTYGEYTLDARVASISAWNSETGIVYLSEDFYLQGFEFAYVYNSETETLDCTIIGVYCDSEHPLVHIETSNVYYGYANDEVDLIAYFNGDLSFTIYVDAETNTLTFTNLRDVVDEYKVE